MKKDKKPSHDPRTETPTGYYLQHTDWLPENDKPTSFFSMRDTLFFTFLVAACFIVGTILWLKPPKIISYDAQNEPQNPHVNVKNLPKQLQTHPDFDHKRFEEISDDDPSITGDETDFPLKETESETIPQTIKSDVLRVIDFILTSLHLPRLT